MIRVIDYTSTDAGALQVRITDGVSVQIVRAVMVLIPAVWNEQELLVRWDLYAFGRRYLAAEIDEVGGALMLQEA